MSEWNIKIIQCKLDAVTSRADLPYEGAI